MLLHPHTMRKVEGHLLRPKMVPHARQRFSGGPRHGRQGTASQAPTSPGGATTPAAAGTSATANTAPAPFLNPDQQLSLNRYDRGISDRMARNARTVSDATFNTQQTYNANQKAHDVNTKGENESDAARGIFQSSIRAGDLNDIDATLAMRNNIATNRWASIVATASGDTNSAVHDWADTHNYYNTLGVANANAITPPTGPPGSPTAGVTATAGPAKGVTKGQGGHVTRLPRGPRRVPRGQQPRAQDLLGVGRQQQNQALGQNARTPSVGGML